MRLRARRRLQSMVALTLTFGASLLVIALSLPASAAAPSTYGWWSQTSISGLGGATQPGVPADGMLVQNSPTGALAIAALKFSIAPGDVVDKLTLTVSGQAVLSQPPIACPATSGFTAVEGGAWSDKPSYDCAHAVTSSVDSAKTKVEFAASQLVRGSELAVVVLAGGSADRVAFSKPGPDSLAETAGPPPASLGSSDTVPSEAQPFAPTVPQFAPVVPAVPVPGGAHAPVAVLPPPTHSLTNPGVGNATLTRDAVTIFLLPVILLAVLYWTDGFGAFSLRRAISKHRLIHVP